MKRSAILRLDPIEGMSLLILLRKAAEWVEGHVLHEKEDVRAEG